MSSLLTTGDTAVPFPDFEASTVTIGSAVPGEDSANTNMLYWSLHNGAMSDAQIATIHAELAAQGPMCPSLNTGMPPR